VSHNDARTSRIPSFHDILGVRLDVGHRDAAAQRRSRRDGLHAKERPRTSTRRRHLDRHEKAKKPKAEGKRKRAASTATAKAKATPAAASAPAANIDDASPLLDLGPARGRCAGVPPLRT
jgi:hypothetical protein